MILDSSLQWGRTLVDLDPRLISLPVRGQSSARWQDVWGNYDPQHGLVQIAEYAEDPTQNGLLAPVSATSIVATVAEEIGHAVDFVLGQVSHSVPFLSAHAADVCQITDPGEVQSLEYLMPHSHGGTQLSQAEAAEEAFAIHFASSFGAAPGSAG
jgi:hypothetical protein